MNLSAVASSPETGEAISSFIQSNFSTIAAILLGLAFLIGLSILVERYIEGWKAQEELAELQDWNMALHDGWRAKATRWGFERHRRNCPRCRGDLFGQLNFNLPWGLKEHTLEDLRERKVKEKGDYLR